METKRKFKMPHVYVIIFSMTIITAIMANIVPAGVFDRIMMPMAMKLLSPKVIIL